MKKKVTIAFLLLTSFQSALAQPALAQPQSSVEKTASARPTLSEAQQQAIKRIKISSEKKAALPAIRLARVVRKIYENMLADRPDEKLRVKLSAEMNETTWELLTIKGQAIRETVNILTAKQKQLIKSEMRKPSAPADLGELITRTFNLGESK